MKTLILIVGNNPEIPEFLAGDAGKKYEVLTADSGPAALQLMAARPVQLVISDVMMPGMDGFALCRQIKMNLTYSYIPVILLTANNPMESKTEDLGPGADAYIEKPFSPQYLQAQLANLLLNRNKLREYFSHAPFLKSIAPSRSDEQFLEQLQEVIAQNFDQEELDITKIATIMNMSRPTFYRKIKSISHLTPNELLNITRLKKAAELLASGEYKIYEVSEIVGFSSATHFGRSFMKQFGMSPSAYLQAKLAGA